MTNKKKNNKKQRINKDIYEKALLFETPGYDIDKYGVQFGRDHDEIRSDVKCRHDQKPHKCRGEGCDLYFKSK